ncbi:hypothetical protein [Schleiferilactobacillus shenzhenensis]|uniref:hypothetical protein n=1 Tax=Schleiferilactobacillus shenzhenensis TaxID=1231337 RepID=UPI00058B76B4|nr:hypothetical protein [Schleiferilactobacillus shenzhenensis]
MPGIADYLRRMNQEHPYVTIIFFMAVVSTMVILVRFVLNWRSNLDRVFYYEFFLTILFLLEEHHQRAKRKRNDNR